MIDLLIANPLLLLFSVAALGYPLGRIKIAGTSLGVAAVLFAGLGIGALHPNLKLPEIVYMLGLVLFVYTIGLSSGPGFFMSLRRRGLRDTLFVGAMLAGAAGLVLLARNVLGLSATYTAGLFAGSLTNTPALAATLEFVQQHAPPALVEQMRTEPVVAYSLAYPMGVVGVIVACAVLQRVWRVDYAAEAERVREPGGRTPQLHNRTLCVTREQATLESIGTLMRAHRWEIVFGRLRRKHALGLIDGYTRLELGDLITVIGSAEALAAVTAFVGEPSTEALELDRRELDYRRVFVSDARIAGHQLKDLNLPQQFGAVVTRIRRGDIELLPRGSTVLELGDRVRVLTHRDHLPAVAKFFGDSYRAVSEIDALTFGLGLALGLLAGLIPFPLPGGGSFSLGLAGGPLLVALALGALGRTGDFVWVMPYSANLTLRQVGLIFFLAGVGTRAGYAFVSTLQQASGVMLFVAGALVTTLTALAALWVGHRVLKLPLALVLGMVAGLHTQPAVLAFAQEQTGNELPSVGYAAVFPIATLLKIVLAQALLSALWRG